MSAPELVSENPLRNGQGWCFPQNRTATAMTQAGCTGPSATGTLTAAGAYATTNAQTRARANEYLVTTPATTAVAGQRFTNSHLTPSNGSGAGGFRLCMLGGPATGVTTSTRRFFMGLAATTSAPTDAQPSAQVNCVGIGYDAADTNLQIMYNDGSGTATKVDTGWARPSADRTSWYMLEVDTIPGSTDLFIRVTDEENGNVFETRATTNIPAYGTYLSGRTWSSVGGTSSVTGVACGGYWFEGEG